MRGAISPPCIVAWRGCMRLGSIGGAHAHLGKLAGQIAKPAPKGLFYVLAVSAADDSDAVIIVAPKKPTPTAAG